ncbi:hypothetical protein [Haploplasma axanthum]|nr:hypothetical protein [Haploplasma axanthum]
MSILKRIVAAEKEADEMINKAIEKQKELMDLENKKFDELKVQALSIIAEYKKEKETNAENDISELDSKYKKFLAENAVVEKDYQGKVHEIVSRLSLEILGK